MATPSDTSYKQRQRDRSGETRRFHVYDRAKTARAVRLAVARARNPDLPGPERVAAALLVRAIRHTLTPAERRALDLW